MKGGGGGDTNLYQILCYPTTYIYANNFEGCSLDQRPTSDINFKTMFTNFLIWFPLPGLITEKHALILPDSSSKRVSSVRIDAALVKRGTINCQSKGKPKKMIGSNDFIYSHEIISNG